MDELSICDVPVGCALVSHVLHDCFDNCRELPRTTSLHQGLDAKRPTRHGEEGDSRQLEYAHIRHRLGKTAQSLE